MSHMLQGERWFFKSILRLRNWRATSPRPSGMLWGWCCYSLGLPTTLDTRRFFHGSFWRWRMLLEPQPTRRFSLPFTSCPTTCCLESRCTINCLLCLPIFLLGCHTRPRSSHTTSCTTSFLVTCTWILICLLNMKGGFCRAYLASCFLRYSRFFFMRWDRCLLLRSSLRMCI